MFVAPPKGAAMPSILAAQTTLLSRFELAGEYHATLGLNAALISSKYYQDRISAASILDQHTLAPILLAVREQGDANNFRMRLEQGRATTTDVAEARAQLPISCVIRRCPQCVQSDLEDSGWAFARTVHQLIPLDICPEHLCPLEEVCISCGTPFGIRAKYPRDRHRSILSHCEVCGCREGKPLPAEPSPASAELAKAFDRCLAGRLGSALRPIAILRLTERLAAWASASGEDLHELFMRDWESASFATACSKAAASCRHIDWAMTAHAIPADPYTTFAFWSFTQAHLPPAWNKSQIKPVRGADSVTRRARSGARQFGLPAGPVDLYLSGRTFFHVKHQGWSVPALKLALEALPRDLRTTVEARHKQARFARGHPHASEICEYERGLRQRQRQRALAHIERGANTRARFRRAAQELAQWLEVEDGPWFASVLRDGKGRRRDPGTFRSRVLEILYAAKPCTVVDRHPYFIKRVRHGVEAMGKRAFGYYRLICQVDPTVYLWMLNNDRSWFHRIVGNERPCADAVRGNGG